ncbi:MAG: GAF domain-containing protein [Chloroflexi bacterium]|nr:GAF domain-containing protein [Chloroflexota bacterium]
MTQEQDEKSVIAGALHTVVEVLSAQGGRFFRWNERSHQLTLFSQVGCCLEDGCVPKTTTDLSLEEAALRSKEPVFLNAPPGDPDDGPRHCSWVAVPLVSNGQPIGVLTLCLQKGIAAKDKSLFNALGHQIGTRLEAALLMRSASRRTERVAALGDVLRGLVAITDPDELIQHLWTDLQQVVPFDQGIFYRYHTEPERLDPVAWKGFTSEEAHQISERSLDRHPGQAARRKQAILSGDTEADERIRYFRVMKRSASCLQVPILDGQRCLGVIGLGSNRKYAFSEEDLAVVTAFADSAAVAIRNAEMFQQNRTIKEQWEAVFHAISDGISIHDRKFHIVQANQALVDLLGMPREEIIGQTCYELFHHCDGPIPGCPLVSTLDSAAPSSMELEEPALGGIFNIRTYPVMDNDRKPVGGVHIVHDITEEKRIQSQMMQMEKLSAIGELVSGVAHELNNPLTAILGYSQLLQSRDLDENTRNDLKRIEQQAQRSARIIQNLLTFARQHEPRQEPVEINDLLLRTIALKSYELRTENIEVVTEFASDLPPLLADPYQLQQVFLNLINNAHQAMVEAHRGKKIVVRTEALETPKGRRMRISFYDDGPSIPSSVASRIFDPFFTTKEVGKGTGLGLSISYGIIQEHKGNIWVETPPGDGPTFTVDLPVLETRSRVEDALVIAQSEADLIPETTSNQHILIVEDEDSLRALLVESFSYNGQQVDSASNGVEAMHRMISVDYDCIISDIKMPGMSGVDLFRWAVNERPEMADRMIFITGDIVNQQTKDFLDHAGQPYLPKPFSVEDLYRAMEKIWKP